jgi:N-acetyl-alpha-D-muramate 1-phosphate uridylyltransferase
VTAIPKTAMVLAAGLGKRMRPITDTMPKPLVKIAGKTLLDWGLDSLARAGVEEAIVNVHYLPDQIVAHVANRRVPKIAIGGWNRQGTAAARKRALLHHQRRYVLDR